MPTPKSARAPTRGLKRKVAFKEAGTTEMFALEHGMLRLPDAQTSVGIVKKGISYGFVHRLATHLGVVDANVLTKIGVTGGTIDRRRRADVLKPDESDKLYRIAKITALAERVLEDPAKAREWLQTKNRALGSVSPFSLLDTEPGVDMVEDVLNRIEYGVYS